MAFIVVLFLYLIGLHCSIAIMEIAAWILIALEIYRKIRLSEPMWFPLWKSMLALTVVVAVSLAMHPPGRPYMMQFGYMRWIVVMYFFAWVFYDQWNAKFEENFKKMWVVALTIAGAYGLFQALTGVDLVRPNTLEHTGVVWRSTGFFSQALTYAYAMGFSLFAICIPSRTLRPKWWQWVAIAAGVVALIASLGRGAWIAAIIAGLAYTFIENRRRLPWFVAGVFVTGFALYLIPSAISTKIDDLIHMRVDHSSMMRWHLWQAYFAIWKDNPLLGVGLFQADFLVPEYYTKLGIDETFVSHSHNMALGWLAGAGILGFGLYAWISFQFLRMAWRLRRVTPWGWSLFLAQIFIHIGGLTENNFFDGEVNHWVMFGWAMCLALTRKYETGVKG